MKMYPVNGQKIFIGDAPMDPGDGDLNEASFNGINWTQVKGWQTAGGTGDSAALVTADEIDSQRTKKAKGTRNSGSMQNVFTRYDADPGQQAVIAAEATPDSYPIRIDGPESGTPSKRYFAALVMTAEEPGGGPNTPANLNVTLELNSNIVRVAAA